MGDLPFYIIGSLVTLGSLGVLFLRELMHAAFALVLTLSALAALYIYAGAEFIGITQLLVYVGGIVVLLIFGIMLSPSKKKSKRSGRRLIAFLLSTGMLCLFTALIYRVNWPTSTSNDNITGVKAIGISIFTDHLLAFELSAVLLLLALIGAMIISRKV